VLHPVVPRAARDVVLDGGYDVVHAHLSVVSPFTTGVARYADAAGTATVASVHSMWASRRGIVRAVRALAGWDRSAMAWTAVSHAAATEMTTVLLAGTPVQVVPNAVDVDWWRAGAGPPRRYDDPVTLISVMRIAGRKRPFALLDILAGLREQVSDSVDLRAVLVGDGPLAHRMEAEIAGRRLDRWVTMAGRLSRKQIRAAYAGADVYVSPAYQESFGLAALEARAAGLPVVAMRAGGVGEFVEHGLEGLLCRDDAEMVEALTALATDVRRRRSIAAHNAVHRPSQDWPRTLSAFDDAYADALGSVRSAVPLDRT
jgi:glycosyltransferase involved in cell wall biosynthesis